MIKNRTVIGDRYKVDITIAYQSKWRSFVYMEHLVEGIAKQFERFDSGKIKLDLNQIRYNMYLRCNLCAY